MNVWSNDVSFLTCPSGVLSIWFKYTIDKPEIEMVKDYLHDIRCRFFDPDHSKIYFETDNRNPRSQLMGY